jgi:K+-sensing histidine kinase KdpD
LGERETSELREQFIAVFGHGLRNPLASITAGARVLTKEDQKETSSEIPGLKRSPQSLQPFLNRRKNRDNLRSDAGDRL